MHNVVGSALRQGRGAKQARMAAAEFIVAGESDKQVARRFRVTKMSVNWRLRAMEVGGIGHSPPRARSAPALY